MLTHKTCKKKTINMWWASSKKEGYGGNSAKVSFERPEIAIPARQILWLWIPRYRISQKGHKKGVKSVSYFFFKKKLHPWAPRFLWTWERRDRCFSYLKFSSVEKWRTSTGMSKSWGGPQFFLHIFVVLRDYPPTDQVCPLTTPSCRKGSLRVGGGG